MRHSMRFLDLGIVALYLVGITLFGARFRRRQSTLKDYFLGGRTAPWWAIALSIVSAETSTLTIIGTPALAFHGNLGFLQIVLGYLLARIVISFLFLPHYFRGEIFTAYELIRRRFGERLRSLTALTFLITRSLAEGVRVFAISIVISIILGTGEIVKRDRHLEVLSYQYRPLAPTTTVIRPITRLDATSTRMVSRFRPAAGKSPAAIALWKRRHGAKKR